MDSSSGVLALASFLVFLWLACRMARPKHLPPSPPSLPIVGHIRYFVSGGIPHQIFYKLASIYGPIFFLRCGVFKAIVVSDTATTREVLKAQDLLFAARPKLTSSRYINYNNQDLAMGDYNNDWRDKKKLITMGFLSKSRLEIFAPVKEEEVAWMALALRDAARAMAPFQLRNYIIGVNCNVTTRIFMGKRYYGCFPEESLQSEAGIDFNKLLDAAKLFGVSGSIADFFPALKWLDWNVPGMKKVHLAIDRFLQAILDEHKQRKAKEGEEDFVDMMISAPFMDTDEKIKAMLFDVMCGATTSTTLIEWTLAELLRHPDVLLKVQQEVDALVGKERGVKDSDIPSMHFLQAAVKEACRLHPPAPLLLPHFTTQGCQVNGYTIPPGTALFVNTYALGRDPSAWDNPNEYKVERFFQGRSKNVDLLGHHYELLPFGSGRRSCPGMPLGLSMGYIVLATLLHCFEIKVCKEIDLSETGAAENVMKIPLEVLLAPRVDIQKLYRTNFCTNPLH